MAGAAIHPRPSPSACHLRAALRHQLAESAAGGASRFTPEQIVARTDAFNAAADRYFADYEDLPFLLGKPYTDVEHFSQRFFDIGILTHWLRLAPGDVVMELGAGTCWLLHFLNRYGCPTIAVDVSPAALEMGRQLFKRDALTNWDLDPRFLPYDGHRLPLPDEHVDKIILYDAFHHVPNQEEILREMARVLKSGGVVAMCQSLGTPGNI